MEQFSTTMSEKINFNFHYPSLGSKDSNIHHINFQSIDNYFYDPSISPSYKIENIIDGGIHFGNDEELYMEVEHYLSDDITSDISDEYHENSTKHDKEIISEYKPSVKKLFSCDLFKLTLNNLNIDKALSQPAFRSSNSCTIGVVGTDEQDESNLEMNHLIFFDIKENGIHTPVKKVRVSDCIRDIKWIDDYHVLFAQGSSLGICSLGYDLNIRDLHEYKSFHNDHIREIDIIEGRKILTGGFDGMLFVKDIVKLSETHNDLSDLYYKSSDIIGSVKWNPYAEHHASFTVDNGFFNIIDIRERKIVNRFNTGTIDLYTHEYIDENHIVLGFGDGKMQIIDLRNPHNVKFFQDTKLMAIGDIIFDRDNKMICSWGIPGFSLWNLDNGGTNVFSYNVQGEYDRKIVGDYIVGTNMIGCTDDNGGFELFSVLK